jgi:cytidyltransferase-like protein
MSVKITVVSGGFDPIHSGHIRLLEGAAEIGRVIVLLNSDDWLVRKKGKAFMPFEERKTILEALRPVSMVLPVDDADGTCTKGLVEVKSLFSSAEIFFCNGGDRDNRNVPELSVPGVKFVYGIGGVDKSNSSSWIISNALSLHSENRVWGNFHELYITKGCKVKELRLKPHSGISYQRHHHRSELWFVKEGEAFVKLSSSDPTVYTKQLISTHDTIIVPVGWWHQLYTNDVGCTIIEIQYGDQTTEDDIERLEYFNNKEE